MDLNDRMGVWIRCYLFSAFSLFANPRLEN